MSTVSETLQTKRISLIADIEEQKRFIEEHKRQIGYSEEHIRKLEMQHQDICEAMKQLHI
jgi:hypothetical protein